MFFFRLMSSCCVLSLETCHSAGNATDNAVRKSFFPAMRCLHKDIGMCEKRMPSLSWPGDAESQWESIDY